MENELLNLLRDLVGDFPSGVNSNALEAAREYLANAESGPTLHEAERSIASCKNCGLPKSKHPGRGHFCPNRPSAYA